MLDYARRKHVGWSRLMRNLITACNWWLTDYDHVILPIPKVLRNKPTELRAELLKAVDAICQHYSDA